MPIPLHKDWIAIKKKYGVADGAAKNIHVGKELDAYWNSGAKTPQAYNTALTKLETALNTYITSVDKKKVKQYDAFQKEFLDKFLGQAHKEKEDTKRAMADLKVYQAEIAKFMTMVQKLDANKSTKVDLDKFKSGPVRGMSAMSKGVRGLTQQQSKAVTEINGWLKMTEDAINNMKAPTQTDIKEFVEATIKTAEKIHDEAKDGGLLEVVGLAVQGAASIGEAALFM
jgi:hypothetical protein